MHRNSVSRLPDWLSMTLMGDRAVKLQNNSTLNPLLSGNPKRGTQANSADPDQMLHNANSNFCLEPNKPKTLHLIPPK